MTSIPRRSSTSASIAFTRSTAGAGALTITFCKSASACGSPRLRRAPEPASRFRLQESRDVALDAPHARRGRVVAAPERHRLELGTPLERRGGQAQHAGFSLLQ